MNKHKEKQYKPATKAASVNKYSQRTKNEEICLDVALGDLQMKQRPKADNVDTNFIEGLIDTKGTVTTLRHQGSRKLLKGNLVTHLDQDNHDNLSSKVCLIANKIENRGVKDNKVAKPIDKSKYYVQLQHEQAVKKQER